MKDIFKNLALFGNIGLTIIINTLVSVGIYKLIERFLNIKSDILFIIFLLLGIISGFYGVYKMITKK